MKKYTLLLIALMTFSLAGWSQSHQADFHGTDIKTSGSAKIKTKSNQKVVVLSSDFQTEEGPDLHVYLASDTSAVDFTDLGSLESFSGKQTYEIPEEVSLEAQPMVLIYCQKYSHLFGYAEVGSAAYSTAQKE